MSHHFTIRMIIVKTHKAKLELQGMRRGMLVHINPAMVETKTETTQTRKTELLLNPRIPLPLMNSATRASSLPNSFQHFHSIKVRNQSSYPSTDNENVPDRQNGVFIYF